jgi:hypothetical protein
MMLCLCLWNRSGANNEQNKVLLRHDWFEIECESHEQRVRRGREKKRVRRGSV